MNDIEQKALALLNEVLEGKALNNTPFTRLPTAVSNLVLLRAIEQHEAFRQEVSDAVEEYYGEEYVAPWFAQFIIPKPKPDPLVDVVKEVTWYDNEITAKEIRASLDARGFEIREKNDG